MISGKHDRRKFLGAATAGAVGGLLAKTVFPSSIGANTELSIPPAEYLFADGITYLNTGTLGPCRRDTIQASMRAWEDLESQPVKFYGILGRRS